jgi:hypothetical protein
LEGYLEIVGAFFLWMEAIEISVSAELFNVSSEDFIKTGRFQVMS